MADKIKADENIVPILAVPSDEPRLQLTREVFIARFDKEPDFYVRVPGRVNLIGEHVDYCGYDVCPMALQQSVFLAVTVDDTSNLRLANVDDKFPFFETDLREISIEVVGKPEWHQYFLCGIKGVFGIFPESSTKKGLSVVVNGDIPPGAGLSSSSALVSAAALATSFAHQLSLGKEEIANICARCERFIGTEGGGMDQAIAFLAKEGCAKRIKFSPLRSSDVKLPSGAVFVVAHSMAEINKAATSDYNCRVVECRLAAQVIAKLKGLDWPNVRRLVDLQNALSVDFDDLIDLTNEFLHSEPYSKDEILEILETTSDRLDHISLTANTTGLKSFKLQSRALHVFKEAQRVQQFYDTCLNHNPTSLQKLGKLMKESHVSLRDLYECSHPDLDELVEMSEGLTVGARLTGAGWGGCMVSLVEEEKVQTYINHLKEAYYKNRGALDRFDTLVFVTAPKSGACVYQ